jgi:hypothetical protein
MILEDYIAQLAKELELEGSLASQVPGVFAFPLEEDLRILITQQSPGFILTCNIISLPSLLQEDFLTRLMLANLFGQGTKGAILGISEDGSLLTLTQKIDYNADYKEFRDLLEDFTNSVDLWREEALKYK